MNSTRSMSSSIKDRILREIRSISPCPKPKGRRGSRSDAKCIYRNIICSFDIETSALDIYEQSIMYIWQFGLGDLVIVGRTWSQFKALINLLESDLKPKERFIVFVHNLSYEFQFLSGIFKFSSEDVFCMDARKIAKCILDDRIEFRCSYILTNLSLDNFTKRMDVKHKKLSGVEFDYKKIRYPWTPLSDQELRYCINDVLGLNESILKYMESEGDSLYTLPMTATGFVRREIKKKVRMLSHKYMVGIQPDMDVMEVLREAFRGGNTCSNRYFVDSILKDVESDDESSAYPFSLMKVYPSSKWRYLGLCSSDDIKQKIDHHYALLMRVIITDLKLKDEFWGFPYIPLSKCRDHGSPLKQSNKKPSKRRKKKEITNEVIVSNGRILKADYLEISITDIDLGIILEEYNCNIVFYQVWMSRYKPLPDVIRAAVNRYYVDKTELKDVEGQEVFYQRQKAMLNSIYGLMVQNPLKHSVLFDDDDYKLDNTKTDEELLIKYTQKGFLPYHWGVWCTAHARRALETGLRITYEQGAIPLSCDTDSIKHLGAVDFTEYNNQCIELCKKTGSYAMDPSGKIHYMGVFEYEGKSDYFITQGAKKYCTCTDGKVKLTCAGVGKKLGSQELMDRSDQDYKDRLKKDPEAKPDPTHGLSLFRDDFTFYKSAGIEAVYNDKVRKQIKVGRHRFLITKNVYFHDSTYTVGKTYEYKEICKNAKSVLNDLLKCNNISVHTINTFKEE